MNLEQFDIFEAQFQRAMAGFRKSLPYMNSEQELIGFTKDVLESILPQGGYFILPYEYLGDRISRIFETSPMRQVCTVRTISKPIAYMVIDDNQVTGLTQGGEQTSIAVAVTPLIGQLTIPTWQVSADLRVSTFMIEDSSFDISEWVITKGSNKIRRLQNTEFVNGSGSGTAKGILSYNKWGDAAVTIGDDDNYTRDALEYIKSGGATSITYAGLVNLQNALLEDYQDDATFMMHRTTWGQILQLVDSQNRPLFQLANLLQTGADRILLGRPVVFAADFVQPTGTNTFAAGSAPIMYGDFKEGYAIIDRIGFQVLRDIYTQASDNLVRYILTTRYGGSLTSYQSLKVLEIAA